MNGPFEIIYQCIFFSSFPSFQIGAGSCRSIIFSFMLQELNCTRMMDQEEEIQKGVGMRLPMTILAACLDKLHFQRMT